MTISIRKGVGCDWEEHSTVSAFWKPGSGLFLDLVFISYLNLVGRCFMNSSISQISKMVSFKQM